MSTIAISGFQPEDIAENTSRNALPAWLRRIGRARAEASTLARLKTMTPYELADLGFEPDAVYDARPWAFRSLVRNATGLPA
ncbi:MAG: hypothetical protein ABL879_09175 [Devosia sp.]